MWLKNQNGDLVNIGQSALVELCEAESGTGIIFAYPNGEQILIFEGTMDEAQVKMDYIGWLLNAHNIEPNQYYLESIEAGKKYAEPF